MVTKGATRRAYECLSQFGNIFFNFVDLEVWVCKRGLGFQAELLRVNIQYSTPKNRATITRKICFHSLKKYTKIVRKQSLTVKKQLFLPDAKQKDFPYII